LLKGRIDLFSLDALVNIASLAGLSVRLVVRKAA
jgi:predicted XRE-type DNA-binding protein